MNKIARKYDLDQLVASRLGLKPKEVRGITKVFIEALMESLAELSEVHLDGFGQFHVTKEAAPRVTTLTQGTLKLGEGKKIEVLIPHKMRVHFRKALPFRRLLQAKHGKGQKKD